MKQTFNLITLPATILDTVWDHQKIASSRKRLKQRKWLKLPNDHCAQVDNPKASCVPLFFDDGMNLNEIEILKDIANKFALL